MYPVWFCGSRTILYLDDKLRHLQRTFSTAKWKPVYGTRSGPAQHGPLPCRRAGHRSDQFDSVSVPTKLRQTRSPSPLLANRRHVTPVLHRASASASLSSPPPLRPKRNRTKPKPYEEGESRAAAAAAAKAERARSAHGMGVSADGLVLKAACERCGSSSDLHGTGCRHATLCVSCGSAMARSGDCCPVCAAPIASLIRVMHYCLVLPVRRRP